MIIKCIHSDTPEVEMHSCLTSSSLNETKFPFILSFKSTLIRDISIQIQCQTRQVIQMLPFGVSIIQLRCNVFQISKCKLMSYVI